MPRRKLAVVYPICFGKLWSPDAVECSGGFDPGYVNPKGSHHRPPCELYAKCGSKTLAVAKSS